MKLWAHVWYWLKNLKFLFKKRAWSEYNGVIDFTVTSNGATGKEWVVRFEQKGFEVTEGAKIMLLSEYFKPTNGVTSNVVVLKGKLFLDRKKEPWRYQIYNYEVWAEAEKRNLEVPNPELACLILEKLSSDDLKVMELRSIAVMHKEIPFGQHKAGLLISNFLIPIKNPSVPGLLVYNQDEAGDETHYEDVGFAYVDSPKV